MTPLAKLETSKDELPDNNKAELKKMNKGKNNKADSTVIERSQETAAESNKIIVPDIEELKNYQRRVERFANENSEFIFPNSNCYHAAIVISKIVEHAKTSVRIYDDSLRGDISGEYDVFGQFIPLLHEHTKKPNAILEIVVRDKTDRNSKIYSLLEELVKTNKNVLVKKASPSFKKKVLESFGGKDYNFAVGDDKAFRLEEYVEKVEVRKAICSFNNTDYATAINNIFTSKEFEYCEPVF